MLTQSDGHDSVHNVHVHLMSCTSEDCVSMKLLVMYHMFL